AVKVSREKEETSVHCRTERINILTSVQKRNDHTRITRNCFHPDANAVYKRYYVAAGIPALRWPGSRRGLTPVEQCAFFADDQRRISPVRQLLIVPAAPCRSGLGTRRHHYGQIPGTCRRSEGLELFGQ